MVPLSVDTVVLASTPAIARFTVGALASVVTPGCLSVPWLPMDDLATIVGGNDGPAKLLRVKQSEFHGSPHNQAEQSANGDAKDSPLDAVKHLSGLLYLGIDPVNYLGGRFLNTLSACLESFDCFFTATLPAAKVAKAIRPGVDSVVVADHEGH